MPPLPGSPFSLIVVLNGSLASEGRTTGGGDLVLFKFLRLTPLQPDLLIPASAQGFVATTGRKFLTRKNNGLSIPGIIGLFLLRIAQGIGHAWQNTQVYDVALAASPFGVDVIPVWFWKARRKGAVIYHVIPDRQAVNWATRIRFTLAAVEQKVTMAILQRACDFLVAGNEFTQQQLAARFPKKPIFVLPAGFDAAGIDRLPAVPKDPNLACFIGRLVSQKGIFDLLKCMDGIRHLRPDLQLVMVGTGPEREFFIAEVKRLNLEGHIRLSGFISEAEKIELLKRATYFFFPSYEEGWGIALAEALYCECRCLCYELPHYRSIFGEFPSYVRLGDPADFVRVFQQAGPADPGQKAFLRQYDDAAVAGQLTGHLATVAAGGAAGRR